jgi:hypothetical protein
MRPVNGTFKIPGVSPNLFDVTQSTQSSTPFAVPSWAGNSVSPDNVVISDSTAPEFATVLNPGLSCETAANVSITRAGLVTYSVEFTGDCRRRANDPLITLVSDAFSGCSLTAGPSNFPQQGNDGEFNNTVTGSLVDNTLILAAKVLSFNEQDPDEQTSLTASWQLEDCPVRPVRCCWGWCRVALSRLFSVK